MTGTAMTSAVIVARGPEVIGAFVFITVFPSGEYISIGEVDIEVSISCFPP